MPKIEVDIVGDASSLGRTLRSGSSMVRGFASQTSSVFKGVLGANAITAVVGAAVGGLRSLGGALSESVGEAREAQKVSAVTGQVIKATGGAAKVSAGQVGDLATQLSNKAGVDDEAIQSGANLLLTFKNVRNEAGKGGAVFDRATAAAVDLSATGFGSISGSSKMLGKALNDPVKGISALSRAGVTFTAQQKEQIAALVKTGDVLGAQKIILGEVEAQVGGVAAAQATAGEKAKVMADNLKEELGTALLPTLDRLAGFFTATLGPAISTGITKVGPVLDRLGAGLAGVLDILLKGDFTGAFARAFNISEDSPIVDFLFNIREGLLQLPAVFSAIGAVAGPAFAGIVAAAQLIAPAVQGIVATAGPAVLGVLAQIRGLALALLPVVLGIATTAAPIIAGIVAQIGGLIATIGPQIAGLLTSVGGIIAAVLPSLGGVVSSIVGLVSAVVPIVLQVFGAVATAIQANLPALQSTFVSIGQTVTSVVSIITSVWATIGPFILPIVTGVFGVVVQVISGAMKIIAGVVQSVSAAMKGDWSGAFQGMLQTAAGVTQIIVGIVKGLVSILTATYAAMVSAASSAWSALKSSTSAAWSGIVSAVLGLVGRLASGIGSALSGITSAASSAWSSVQSATSSAWSAVVSTVSTAAGSVLATVRAIPGQISAAFSGLGGLLVASGRSLLEGLAQGIRSGVGAAIGAASDAISAVRAFFPFSPAKRGPFSGSGWTLYSGRAIGAALAQGMGDSRREVVRGADALAEAAAIRTAVIGTRSAVRSAAARPRPAVAVAAATDGGGIDYAALQAAVYEGSRTGSQDGIQAQLKVLDPRGEHALVTRGIAFGRRAGPR